jgi:hypothetical protein
MTNNTDTELDITSYEAQPPTPPMQLSPLQEQLLESATEMGLDVDWFKENILQDENCLNGLALITE